MESAEPSKVQHKKSDHAPGGQSGTRSEYRAVYLLVWPNPIFKAHWAFFIPNADDRTVRKGNYIHVNGNVHDGYQIEFVHGYDVNLTTHRPLPPIEIGRVRADLLHAENQSDSSTYETPSDDIERLIAAVPAPEASLRSAGMGSTGTKSRNTDLSDCQWWIEKVVQQLEQDGVLIAPWSGLNKNKRPGETIEKAPKH